MNDVDIYRAEELLCSPYGATSRQSRGRIYLEEESPHRTCFQRDRDRVVHSKSFRRLQHKTQVFVAMTGDHFRTRLTHTLEVSHLARHIARLLQLNEDLTEVISLAHDLGHTPFGHAGEKVLNELMKNHGGFEHNQQSFRVVMYTEKKYKQFHGLNLTYETLSGLLKHTSPHDSPSSDIPASVHKNYITTLEAQVVNVADEIAYDNHDLDDGLASGIIKFSDVAALASWQAATKANKKQHTNLSDDELRYLNIRWLIGSQLMSLVEQSCIQIQSHKLTSLADVQSIDPAGVICFDDEWKAYAAQTGTFLMETFYRHPTVKKMNDHAREVVNTIFAYYEKHPKTLPEISAEGDSYRQLADYISGMTDVFAEKEYQKITNETK